MRYTGLMAERATPHRPLSIEEYLELERESTVRHEYVAGEIHAMTGATRRHNRVIQNVSGLLWSVARGGPCRVSTETVKVRIRDEAAYYPDVMVACGEEPDDPYVESEPCLLVEVVSPSSEAIDHREKLAAYKSIPTLRAYLIVSQERRWVERHFRGEDGIWRRADLVDEGRIPVPCPPGAQLTLDEVYEGL